MPTVSFVMPSYNQGEYIEEAIRSLLLQGYPSLEVIVMDAGSEDGTRDVLRRYDSWLTHWESRPDHGQSHAINKGLLMSSGRYFNWHNADDVLAPGALHRVVNAFEGHSQVGCVFGYPVTIDKDGCVLRDSPPPGPRGDRLHDDLAWCARELRVGCQPGSLMNRELVLELGMLDENLHYVMDADLFIRIGLVKPLMYVDEPLVYYRTHGGAKTQSSNRRRARERLMIARKLYRRRNLPEAVRRQRSASYAKAYRFAARVLRQAERPVEALVREAQATFARNERGMVAWWELVAEAGRIIRRTTFSSGPAGGQS